MNEQNLRQLALLLDEYYKYNTETCRYDCDNCGLGILESYGSGYSCAIETVERNIFMDLEG